MGLNLSMNFKKHLKPVWHRSGPSPIPNGGACVISISRYLPYFLLFISSVGTSFRILQRICFSVYWLSPRLYLMDPPSPAIIRPVLLSTMHLPSIIKP